MGGHVHLRRNEAAQATPHGRIVFFTEFRATGGAFDRWVLAMDASIKPRCGRAAA